VAERPCILLQKKGLLSKRIDDGSFRISRPQKLLLVLLLAQAKVTMVPRKWEI
jgi:hypothetical protein